MRRSLRRYVHALRATVATTASPACRGGGALALLAVVFPNAAERRLRQDAAPAPWLRRQTVREHGACCANAVMLLIISSSSSSDYISEPPGPREDEVENLRVM